MAKYVATKRLQLAVKRLGESKAQTRLNEFLILKRGIVLSPAHRVRMSLNDTPYIQAINDLMQCIPPTVEAMVAHPIKQPLINVYGAARRDDLGYRAEKYYSNGINSAISGTAWEGIADIIEERPRVVALNPGAEERLADVMLTGHSTPKPRLDDSVVWFFRATDISAIIDEGSAITDNMVRLVGAYRERLGLADNEIAILFDMTPDTVAAGGDRDWLTEEPASPTDYLPRQQVVATPHADTSTVLCSQDLVVSLAAKGFAIYTGPSGTGKTRAGIQLSQAVGPLGGNAHPTASYAFIPVGSDWTDPRNLLGFKNPFGKAREKDGRMTNETYDITDALRLLLAASHPDRQTLPHFLVLDEMNLSHVERYFSPFLSILEANHSISGDEKLSFLDVNTVALIADVLEVDAPGAVETDAARKLAQAGKGLPFASNVFIIGTVNVDETTYMFSPKVLDRAHVIELQSVPPSSYIRGVDQEEEGIQARAALIILQDAIQRRRIESPIVLTPHRQLADVAASLDMDLAALEKLTAATATLLDGAYTLLAPLGFGFGFRVVNEVFDYLIAWLRAMRTIAGDDPSFFEGWQDALDKAFLQKVLPKLHGNRRQLGDSLLALAAFLTGNDKTGEPPARYRLGDASDVGIDIDARLVLEVEQPMERSRKKLARMNRRLVATGYVTFVE